MGGDVHVMSNGDVIGTFPHVKEFTGFSGIADEQSGNYLYLKLGEKYSGKQITVQRVSGQKGKAVTSEDLEWVLRLTDGNETVYEITADEMEKLTLNFTKATIKQE